MIPRPQTRSQNPSGRRQTILEDSAEKRSRGEKRNDLSSRVLRDRARSLHLPAAKESTDDVWTHTSEHRLFFRTRQQFLALGCASRDASTARVFKRNLAGDAHLLSLRFETLLNRKAVDFVADCEKNAKRETRNVSGVTWKAVIFLFFFFLSFLLRRNVYIFAIAREKWSTYAVAYFYFRDDDRDFESSFEVANEMDDSCSFVWTTTRVSEIFLGIFIRN